MRLAENQDEIEVEDEVALRLRQSERTKLMMFDLKKLAFLLFSFGVLVKKNLHCGFLLCNGVLSRSLWPKSCSVAAIFCDFFSHRYLGRKQFRCLPKLFCSGRISYCRPIFRTFVRPPLASNIQKYSAIATIILNPPSPSSSLPNKHPLSPHRMQQPYRLTSTTTLTISDIVLLPNKHPLWPHPMQPLYPLPSTMTLSQTIGNVRFVGDARFLYPSLSCLSPLFFLSKILRGRVANSVFLFFLQLFVQMVFDATQSGCRLWDLGGWVGRISRRKRNGKKR